MGSLILFRRSKNGIGQVISVGEFNKTRVECEGKIGQKLSFFAVTITFTFLEFNQKEGKCEEKIDQKLCFHSYFRVICEKGLDKRSRVQQKN